MATVAGAYGRATGTMPTSLPINVARSPSTPSRPSRLFRSGCCATFWVSPDRSPAAASTSARPAPAGRGKAVNPCAIPVEELTSDDEVTRIEGFAATACADLHPM
ncbi:hypothetical protein GCM10009646_01470 [Streptomyces aureus]